MFLHTVRSPGHHGNIVRPDILLCKALFHPDRMVLRPGGFGCPFGGFLGLSFQDTALDCQGKKIKPIGK